MSIKNNILNNFLSTATISALALGGLASVALAPIVVNAANGSLEIRADKLTDSDFYHVCRYNLSTSDLDPDGDGTDVVLSNVGTTLKLVKSDLTDPKSADTSKLKDKVSDTPDATGEYQIMSNGDVVYYSKDDTLDMGATATVTLPTGATPNFGEDPEATAAAVDAVTKWHLNGTTLTVRGDADGDGTADATTTEVTLPTGATLTTKKDKADDVKAADDYNITTNTLTVWVPDVKTNVKKTTLEEGNFFTDKDGTTFISDGTSVFSIDLDSGKNANSEDDGNAPLTKDNDFRVDSNNKDALLVLLKLSGPESTIENAINSDADDYCEYDSSGTSQKYHPFRNLQGRIADAILVDGETFKDDEDDFETLVSADGFSAIKKLQAGQSDTPGETNNETLQVSKGDKEEINTKMLKFEADGATESQIIYTIVSAPKHGSIIYDRGNGQKDTLVKGSQFSQQNIDNGDIEYKHKGENEEDDEFTFKVYNADKEPYSDYTTSVKTMEIEIGNTDSDFKACGTFELKAGQDAGDRVIMSKGVVEICDSKQDDNDKIEYTIVKDDVDGDERKGKGKYVVVYKDNNTNGNHDDGEEVEKFTLEDVEDGDIIVELLSTAPDNVNSETMSLDIKDGESDEDAKGVTLKFTFEDNTDPFVVNNTLNLGGVNQKATVTEDDLKVDDGDDNYLDLKLEVTSSPAFGILRKDGAPLGMGSTFEMEDIKDGKITYENTLDTSLDTVGFKATDPSGDNTGFTFRVNVTGGTTPSDCDFSDVPSSQTFYKEICGLKEKGIIGGYPDGSFNPTGNVLRKEMSKFLVKGLNITEDTSCTNFPDANQAEVGDLEPYIHTLKCLGISNGNNGSFLSHHPINRGEVFKLLVKSLEHKGVTLEMTITDGFADVPTDHTFYNEIYKAYSAGLMNGQLDSNGNLQARPGDNISRGEMTKVIMNAHKKLVQDKKL